MHEFEIVQSLINALLPQLEERGVTKVTALRLRRGSTFSEEALRYAFTALARGTVLEGAEILVETKETPFQCPCGYQKVLTCDDLVGHLFVCPHCGRPQEIDEAHELELLEVLAETAA